jgi:hypothetical protein
LGIEGGDGKDVSWFEASAIHETCRMRNIDHDCGLCTLKAAGDVS